MKPLHAGLGLLGAAALLAVFAWTSAAVAGEIAIDNRSQHPIKAVARGGRATLDAESGPTAVTFDNDADIGIDLKVWWTDEPRQLCQTFVPWQRTVIVSGSRTIRCRSE